MRPSSLRLRIPSKIKTVVLGSCHLSSNFRQVRFDSSSSSSQPSRAESDHNIQPFQKIPGTGTFQSMKNVLFNDGISKLHLLEQESRRKYGTIFRQNLGPLQTVYFCDPDTIQSVYKMEGKYPKRDPEIPIWSKYKKERGRTQGVFFAEGEAWHQSRSALNPKMLKTKEVAHYVPQILDVTNDLVLRLRDLQKASNDNTLNGIEKELFKWSLESVGTVLFERRFGLFKNPASAEAQRFIEAVHQAFHGLSALFFYPAWLTDYYKPKSIRDFYDGMDVIYNFADSAIQKKLEQIAEKGNKVDDDEKVDFLTFLIGNKKMPLKKITENFVEILFASVDTTSITTLWTLYNLAKNPDKQAKLHSEITSVLKPDEVITAAHINQMHYLRACIRETLRLYPASVVNTRIMEKDITVQGYNIPKETLIMIPLYTMGRDPDIFDEPNSFKPERWLRGDESNPNYHPFASLTFGHGVRMCIGRRIAMMEMSLLISKVVREFHLESMNDVGTKVTFVLVPDQEISLKATERHTNN